MISNRSSLMTRHICACGRPVPFNADGKATYTTLAVNQRAGDAVNCLAVAS